MRTALIQMTSSDDPAENLRTMRDRIAFAAAEGAGFVLTPEVCNCVSTSRERQREVLQPEAEDATLAGLRDLSAHLGVWTLVGSLALKTDDPDGRFANRSFLLDPSGQIVARYDKIHMFDVDLPDGESYRESAGFRPGDRLVLAATPFGTIGLTICYDLRFPHIFRALAKAGAEILTVPAAFATATGAAHWETLLRARAIETGCYVLAPAQTGVHSAVSGRSRVTFGHTMAIDPWGKILRKSDQDPDISFINLNLADVHEARRRVPSLVHDRPFEGPQ